MLKKSIIFIIFSLVLYSSAAWSVTRHTDYGTTMEIKFCTECHILNNISPNHGSMWMKEHRLYKEKLPSNCNDCHNHSFCMDCHYGGGIDADLHVSNSGVDYMPKSHRTDFRELHPIKAREEPRSCYRCHDAERFCAQCHSKFKPDELAPISHRGQFSNINVKSIGPNHAIFNAAQCQTCHPNGVLPKHQWSSEHAREARRNLSSCQTCHPQGDVCLKCHSADTGLQINPHPRNWGGGLSRRLGRAGDNRSCIRCHKVVP